MLTIDISKSELKKAFFSEIASYTREYTADSEYVENLDTVLLKIMLENYRPREAA